MEEVNYHKILKALKSEKSSTVYNMLVKIRKQYSKNSKVLKEFIKTNIIKEIVLLMDHPKHCSVALSIVADACLHKHIIYEVIHNKGVESLARIMKSLLQEEYKNRACRALGNIAKCDTGLKIISKMNLIPHILQFLKDTNDEYCQQTTVRTLRIIGKNAKLREVFAEQNVVNSISKLLFSSSKEVVLHSIRALAELTEKSPVNACQLREQPCIEKLVELYSNDDEGIRLNSLTTLKNLAEAEDVKSDLIKGGGLQLFIDAVLKSESLEVTITASFALCNLLEYLPMWSYYGVSRHLGLKAVVAPLRQNKFAIIHDGILGAIIPLCLERENSEVLVDVGVIPVVIELLREFVERYKTDHPLWMIGGDNLKCPSLFGIALDSDEDELVVDEENYTSCFDFDSIISQTSMYQHMQRETPPHCEVVNIDPPHTLVKAHQKIENQNFPNFHTQNACSPSSSGYHTATSPHFSSDYSASSPLGGDPLSPNSNFQCHDTCSSPIYSSSGSDTCEDFTDTFSSCTMTQSEDIAVASSKVDEDKAVAAAALLISLTDDLISKSFSQQPITTENEITFDDSPPSTSNKRKAETHSSCIESVKNICFFDTAETPQRSSNSASMVRSAFIDKHLLMVLDHLFFHCKSKSNSEYAGKHCFTTIMDYICSVKNHCDRADTLLINIVENRNYFEKLVLNGFVAELEKRIPTVHDLKACLCCSGRNDIWCTLLNALRREAESEYGIGTLSHILVTAEKASQVCAVNTASKLIIHQSAIYKFINKGNALSILLQFVSEDSEPMRSDAILCLCHLYQNLSKSKAKEEKCCFSSTCNLEVRSGCSYKEAVTDVVFDVGGVYVSACRNTICGKSEYFNALLQGHFSENQKEVVSMAETSAETLTMIFHFLHGCKTETVCRYVKRIPLAVLLEMLADCEKFLLFDIKAHVEDTLCHNLSPNTISKIYQSAKANNSTALSKRAIEVLLNHKDSDKDVRICFNEIIDSAQEKDFYSDIKMAIENMLPRAVFLNCFK